jgi:2-hydroxy-3-keto-5-methylthiopentenyl-1-phosphate phosphatase
MTEKIAVFSDFDGTLTCRNVLDWLYERFCGPNHRHFVDRWECGEISIREELEGCFATNVASRAEMESFLNRVQLRPGLPDLLNLCHDRAYAFAILSEGLVWYINYLLHSHNIFDVTVFANQIHFQENGYHFSFPWFDPQYPLRGTPKASIIRKHQAEGSKVIFIGDGLSDTEAAEAADFVFARDHLLKYTATHGIAATEFSSLFDITKHLKRMV